MPPEVIPQTEQESPEPGTKKEERGRSTIVFPYLPLEDAVKVAVGVQAAGGTHCEIEQLAGQLNTTTDSSNFNLKLNTARIFGLIERAAGVVRLTSLGVRICDPQTTAAAKAEAFLAVPLYAKIHEQFKGVNLPPMTGLENAIGNMGVATKQKSNARQVFQRSATQAGFFAFGPGRLVAPIIKGNGAAVASVTEQQHNPPADSDKPLDRQDGGGDGGGGSQHPFIQGLIKTLPKTDGPWPMEKRVQWLQAAVSVFNLIYTDDGAAGRIEVRIPKEPTQ